jgi:hypothetical protein
MSLLSLVRLEVFNANTSLFMSRNESRSFSSSSVKSWDIITILLGTLGSSGTVLISHSGSIGLLMKLPSFCLHVMLVLSSIFSSYRQFIFLWPVAKPSSMFLASF